MCNKTRPTLGCAYCSNRKVLAGFNDLQTTHPNLAKELDDPVYKSNEIVTNTHKPVRWVCGKGHNWVAAVYNRVAGNGCPVCANYVIIPGINDMKTTHPNLYAELKDKSKGTQIPGGHSKKLDWVCNLGHEWRATPHSRLSNNSGCPVCANLVVLPGFNDLKP